MAVLPRKFGLSDLRAVRLSGKKLAMLTAYDFTTARLMHEAGVPMILVGDSAANVVLGHPTTLPVSLEFMIEITAAVRRAAPQALLMADMPFGSVGQSTARSVRNVVKMIQQSGADCVKIEASPRSAPLIARLTDMGVAVIAHLGLRPQSIGVLGAYRYQGRTAAEAIAIVESAEALESAGAAGLWQFVRGTGEELGLTVNHWVDLRLDPQASTQAGARYLGMLRERFGTWELAFAAYNMGYGALLRAIRKYNTNDY